jgi:hypothetical protein
LKTNRIMPVARPESPREEGGVSWTEEDLPRLFPNVAKRFR